VCFIYIHSFLLYNLPIEAIKYKTNKQVEEILHNCSLLAVGEFHGVAQNAELYLRLFREFDFDVLALEYPQSLIPHLEAYLKGESDIIDHYSLHHPADGRVNFEYLSVIKALHDENLLKHIVYFDNEESFKDWNARDEMYAREFLKQYDPGLKTLIVAGAYHTGLDKFFSEYEDETLVPMCFHLREELGEFPTVKIVYHTGEYYNFSVQKFDKDPPTTNENYWEISEDGIIEFNIIKASPITLN
jgi:hypothetical protein